jgi:ferredoxin-NADP reductase
MNLFKTKGMPQFHIGTLNNNLSHDEPGAYISSFAQRFGMGTKAENRPGIIRAEVIEVRQIAEAIKLFRLKPRAGRFPRVEAGAHLKVGVVLTDRTSDFRQYTIVDSDRDGSWYEIAVLRESDGRGGSLYMHEEVDLQKTVSVVPPENDFPLNNNATHSILVAGGIGITPILAMARELQSLGRSAELHYSARGAGQAAFLGELRDFKSVRTNFYDTSCGPDRRMNLKQVLGPLKQGTHIYVCGPHRLIADTLSVAERLGYPSEAVHSEAFAAPAPLSSDLPVEIKFAKTGKLVMVNPGQSILDAALSEGVEVSHSCKRGECGLCATTVVEGSPDHRDRFLNAAGKEGDGKMCICVSWARSSSLVLDL